MCVPPSLFPCPSLPQHRKATSQLGESTAVSLLSSSPPAAQVYLPLWSRSPCPPLPESECYLCFAAPAEIADSLLTARLGPGGGTATCRDQFSSLSPVPPKPEAAKNLPTKLWCPPPTSGQQSIHVPGAPFVPPASSNFFVQMTGG